MFVTVPECTSDLPALRAESLYLGLYLGLYDARVHS